MSIETHSPRRRVTQTCSVCEIVVRVQNFKTHSREQNFVMAQRFLTDSQQRDAAPPTDSWCHVTPKSIHFNDLFPASLGRSIHVRVGKFATTETALVDPRSIAPPDSALRVSRCGHVCRPSQPPVLRQHVKL